MNESKFQFRGFNIVRSLIERNNNEESKQISLNFAPRGILNIEHSTFQLELGVKIEDENKSFNIDIEATALYTFEKLIGKDELDSMFYLNAPAILFPYLRAYISTLTNLSGFKSIDLPTLNMTGLGQDLKKNTIET